MSKAAVVVDSACTLPPQFLHDFHIVRVPIQVRIDDEVFADPCDDQRCLALFQGDTLGRRHRISTDAPTQLAFEEALHGLIDAGFQSIWVQTISRDQGVSFERASAAVARVNDRLTTAGDVSIRLIDSGAVLAGQSLLAAETVRRLQFGEHADRLQRTLDQLRRQVQTFALFRDPMVAADRLRTRGERAVQWSQALFANALGIHPLISLSGDQSHLIARTRGFDHAAAGLFHHVEACIKSDQLSSSVITVQYAGSLTELRALPGYLALEETAKAGKLQWIPSVASLAGGIYASPGSLLISVAGDLPSG